MLLFANAIENMLLFRGIMQVRNLTLDNGKLRFLRKLSTRRPLHDNLGKGKISFYCSLGKYQIWPARLAYPHLIFFINDTCTSIEHYAYMQHGNKCPNTLFVPQLYYIEGSIGLVLEVYYYIYIFMLWTFESLFIER